METPKFAPVKRNKALVQFSREHHFALLLCRQIRGGLAKNIDIKRIAAYTLYFFDTGLEKHFREEERILFSKLEDSDALKQQVIREHENVYALIKNIRNENYTAKTLSTFADDLDNHIRFEERNFFNYIQEKLTDAQLQDVLNSHVYATVNLDEKWNDPFWKN